MSNASFRMLPNRLCNLTSMKLGTSSEEDKSGTISMGSNSPPFRRGIMTGFNKEPLAIVVPKVPPVDVEDAESPKYSILSKPSRNSEDPESN